MNLAPKDENQGRLHVHKTNERLEIYMPFSRSAAFGLSFLCGLMLLVAYWVYQSFDTAWIALSLIGLFELLLASMAWTFIRGKSTWVLYEDRLEMRHRYGFSSQFERFYYSELKDLSAQKDKLLWDSRNGLRYNLDPGLWTENTTFLELSLEEWTWLQDRILERALPYLQTPDKQVLALPAPNFWTIDQSPEHWSLHRRIRSWSDWTTVVLGSPLLFFSAWFFYRLGLSIFTDLPLFNQANMLISIILIIANLFLFLFAFFFTKYGFDSRKNRLDIHVDFGDSSMRVQQKGADESSKTLDLSDKNIKTWEIRTHSNSTTKLNLGYLQEDASFCEVWTFFKSDIPFEAQNYLVYALNEHTQNAQEDKKPRQ